MKGAALFLRGLWVILPWVPDETFAQWERDVYAYRRKRRLP